MGTPMSALSSHPQPPDEVRTMVRGVGLRSRSRTRRHRTSQVLSPFPTHSEANRNRSSQCRYVARQASGLDRGIPTQVPEATLGPSGVYSPTSVRNPDGLRRETHISAIVTGRNKDLTVPGGFLEDEAELPQPHWVGVH